MAPRKRPGPFDSENESNDEGSAASSGSQTSSKKRRRASSASTRASDASSARSGSRDVSTPPSDAGSDQGSETEDDDMDLDDENAEVFATQREETRRRNQSDECGVLESIEIINFMCHKHYVFRLGPRINFICGKNGSGKSAILTAIILCLGGKASATNRGSSLKDLIRQGQDSGSITCRIKNTGDGPFMPEEFGDTIIIERQFSRSGTASFKIKNARGRIVSTKRVVLDEICDHFGFQVENPMNILSQDLARQFITSANAADKYKLFVKGVLLEQLDQDYCIIENNVNTVNPQIADAEKDLEGLKSRADMAKKKAEASDRYEHLRSTWRDWRRQLAWEQVRMKEHDRDMYAKEILNSDQKIDDANKQVVQLDLLFQQATARQEAAQRINEGADADVKAVQDEKAEEQGRLDHAKGELSIAQAELRNVKDALRQVKETVQTKNEEIEKEIQRLQELDGGGGAHRLRELEETRDAVSDAQNKLEAHARTKDSINEKIGQAMERVKQAEAAVRGQEAEVKAEEQRLSNIRKEGGVQDTAFGPRMPALLKAIQQERRFQASPVGPIGKHIKLLQPEWSSILEKAFGSTLNGFVVTNKRDQDLMVDLQKKFGIPPNVFIVGSAPIDTRSQEPDESFLSISRALDIDNVLVRNLLVIQNRIENHGLIADSAEASDILFPRNGQRPLNLARCFSFHPTKKTKGILLHVKGGRPAQDPVLDWSGPVRMNSNVDDQIRVQQGVLNDTKAHLIDLEEALRSGRDALIKVKQEKTRYSTTATALRVALQEAEDRVETLQEAISEDNVKSGNLDVLRQTLAEAKQQQELHEGSYMDAATDFEEKKRNVDAIRGKLDAFDRQIKTREGLASERKREYQKADQDRAHALGEKNAGIARVADAKKDRGSMNETMEKLTATIEELATQASALSARVNFPEGETYDSLLTKYDVRKNELAAAQKRIGGTREELEAEKARTATAHAQAERDIKSLTQLSNALHATMHNRRERWQMFQRFITVAAKFNFQFLLGERGFRGELILDHKKKLLDLRVEPDITKKSDKGRDARTLSGGEKSFSQICLLLAIWEAMGSPIRCLDEFDVYMDAVNRRMSVNLLIEGARKSTGKQFILISPGAKEDIPAAPDVNVQEVAEPVRGQTTLSFGES